jgi:hypothetical protein
MPLFAALFLLFFGGLTQAQAQDVLPDHRYVYHRDVDFYGADLTNLFDTTQTACERACSAQESCVAFTFNTRTRACFPKFGISDRQPYTGALSASKIKTDPMLSATARDRAGTLDFLGAESLSAARNLVADNARRYSVDGLDSTNPMASLRSTAQAVALTDGAEFWVQLARYWMRENDQFSYQDRQRMREEAIPAAVNGYLRMRDVPGQVAALEVLVQALEMNGRGRDMIPALRLALDLSGRDDIAVALDDAIGKYGFRIVEHRVDSDAAAPRICAEFSERLVQAGVDYEPFVRVEGRGLAVQADDKQICIDGVEHGARYDVTFRAGLPAASGETLFKDVALQLYVRDRTPLVRFPGRAYVLPRSADAALPVETVNVDTLDLKLSRVSDRNLVMAIKDSYFGRPLSKYEADRFSETLAEQIWTGTGNVQNELNADMTTRLPMGDALVDQPPGIYTLSAMVPGQDPYDAPAATQWFVLSDLGLSTWSGTDGLDVSVRGLSDAGARSGVKLSLISQANAVLGTATSDADGFASFPAGLTRGDGAASPALLLAEDGSSDVAFLPLTDPAFDLSDRGVEGRPPAPPIDTYLATDRGAYRAGETIQATVLTRDERSAALTDLPITAILRRPDGVEYSRTQSHDSVAGGHVFALPTGTDVPRGAWRLDILSDVDAPALASQTVLVEDFLPERIDFTLTLPDAPLRLGDTPPLTIDARYLFGAPATNLAVEGDVRLRATRSLSGWDGFQFGRYDTPFSPRSQSFGDTRTDAQGRAALALQLPDLDEDAGLPLEAEVIARLTEGSGRPVERRLKKVLAPDDPVIGIKPGFDDVLPEGGTATFEIVAVGPDLNAVPMLVTWTVNKVETRYQWYRVYGNWEWEPTTRRIRVSSGELTLGDTPQQISVPTEWGAYEVVVERAGGGFAETAVSFSSGWYGGDESVATPDRLTLSLDATEYAPGDTAQLRLVPEGDGVALITVLSNRVIDRKVVSVTAGENLVPLDVTEDWGSGAYVTASVLRPMNVADGMNPARSLGLAHATVRPGDKQLRVRIDAPDVVDGQAGILRAAVQVDGVKPGETAFVTLAAVDVGILNLTGFEAPDATGHYFGQRRLGVEMRDVYGRLINGQNGAMGTVRSGGDAASSAQLQSPPPTEELMAFFTGPVTVGPDGRAEVEIVKPAFNGTIRLMAVAWSDSGVGDASRDVIARDPVVVTASLPRFMAPGDNSRLLLEFVTAEPLDAAMDLAIFADAGIAVSGETEMSLPGDTVNQRLKIPVTAREIGDHLVTIVLTLPGGKELRKVLTLPVRDNDPELTVTRQFALGIGETFTFDTNVFADLRPGTASATLTAGPLARFDVPGLLRQLDRYPYGCTEQVTSGAMPLLYLSSVAQAAGMGEPERIQEKVYRAIAQVLTRQASNGAFGLWSAESGNFWLDAYVSDFMSRARAEGYAVPDLAFTIAMDNLRNRISYAPDFDRGGEDVAYALLVLAREGAVAMGDLRYYADTKGDAFGTPLAAAQLGAALAAYGDPARADAMFRRAAAMLAKEREDRGLRDDFGSNLRDTAGVLKLVAEAGSAAIDSATLASVIGGARKSLSTQEAAQVVLAAHALATPGAVPGLTVDGVETNGPVVKRLSDADSQASVITNVSAAPMDVTMTTYGVPLIAPGAGGYGYALAREYYAMDGTRVEGPSVSGDRLVVILTVTPFEDTGARLMVDDPLPAGFEIDNPNLLRGGDIDALDWLDTAEVEHVEFRSDRFIAAVTHSGAEAFRLAYIVRAVTPGSYHHPAATVTDMYRPEFRANTETGSVLVNP